ncbi:hypothetical protein PPS11_32995 [Pseudomonas putida S11]|nr:hypothetical protein PPS11_32995 [Pseudomonas putida S11]
MENDANGASASGKRLGAAALGLLHSHIELFGIELQEQKGRTLSLLLFAGLALVFALLLLTALSGLLLVLLWDSYRLAGIIGLCVFYGIAALYCGLRFEGRGVRRVVALRRHPRGTCQGPGAPVAMSLPELPNTRNPRELRKALLRLRMEMHRQEIRHESAQLLEPLRRVRGMGSSLHDGLGIKHAPLWGIGAVVALGFLTGKGVRSGNLARLVAPGHQPAAVAAPVPARQPPPLTIAILVGAALCCEEAGSGEEFVSIKRTSSQHKAAPTGYAAAFDLQETAPWTGTPCSPANAWAKPCTAPMNSGAAPSTKTTTASSSPVPFAASGARPRCTRFRATTISIHA